MPTEEGTGKKHGSSSSAVFDGFKKKVGKNYETADELLSHPWHMRKMKEDGENYLGTANYDQFRINVAVEKGIITEILSIN